jgi:hypothetical protein
LSSILREIQYQKSAEIAVGHFLIVGKIDAGKTVPFVEA